MQDRRRSLRISDQHGSLSGLLVDFPEKPPLRRKRLNSGCQIGALTKPSDRSALGKGLSNLDNEISSIVAEDFAGKYPTTRA